LNCHSQYFIRYPVNDQLRLLNFLPHNVIESHEIFDDMPPGCAHVLAAGDGFNLNQGTALAVQLGRQSAQGRLSAAALVSPMLDQDNGPACRILGRQTEKVDDFKGSSLGQKKAPARAGAASQSLDSNQHPLREE
jgi:hypothetical protein